MTASRRTALRRPALPQTDLVETASKSADAYEYQPYRVVARYWLLIAVTVVISAGLVAGLNALRSATYASTSTVAWNANYRADLPALYGAPSANVQPTLDLASAAIWVRGDVVMGSAATALGIPTHDLRGSTTVSSSPLDGTITITVSASAADDARKRTDAVTNSFVKESRNRVLATLRAQAAQVGAALKSMSGDVAPSVTADLRSNEALLSAAATGADGPSSVVQAATAPVDTRGKVTVNAAIGGALGLVIGVLVALGLGARSRRRHSAVAE